MASARTRILDAAWDIARRDGVAELTLADVGRAAGVSRQAVYLHFENRAGLLLQMARRIDHSSGFVARLAAARGLPPREELAEVLRLWFDYLPEILPVALALEAAAVIGDEGAAAYLDRMSDWRESLRISVQALADAGELDDSWTVDEATDWVWARTHPAGFHHLTTERKWPACTVAERTIASVFNDITVHTGNRFGTEAEPIHGAAAKRRRRARTAK